MDSETLNKLIAQTSALERIVILLVADRLQHLSSEDAEFLEATIGAPFDPPSASDLAIADDLAGRTVIYRQIIGRILKAAQEIAGIRAA